MPSLKALRTRIRSVKNTQQITKTMKMVAAAKVRRARSAVDAARPYAARLQNVLAGLARSGAEGAPVLLTGRPTVKTVRLVVCGTDRGLCGGLNANLIKTMNRWVAGQQAQGRAVQLVAVGRKVRDAMRQTWPTLLVASHTDLGRNVEFAHAQMLAAEARAAFEDGSADEVHLLYAECRSMLTQAPTVRQFAPFSVGTEDAAAIGLQPVTEYEPDEATVLSRLLPLNLNMQMFSALLETAASEHAARMTAMDAATRNAGELRKKLTVQYNRSRQATITKELIEIISGAEAL